MKKFYVVFYKDDKSVCCTHQEGKDADDASENAELTLLCRFPNVNYDKVEVIEEERIL